MPILGHQTILELLPKLSAQTLLFTGPEGVGRRAVARWWMRGLNCERGFPACGNCASCRLADHPDYLEVAPETETKGGRKARQQQIRLEQIASREEGDTSLLAWISTYPRYKAKVGVIDSAHLLNESAANALLKVLEEPPGYARLVLVAPSRELVLPTLVSRSMEMAFGPLPEATLRSLSTDPMVLAFAEGAVGRLRWALDNPAEFGKLTSRAEGVREALAVGPAQTLEALKLLNELEGGLAYLGRELREHFAPQDPRRPMALQALAQTQEALTAYVGEELALTWFGLKLRQLEAGA
jgi:DNA polymerase-3 subunit delta'